MLGKVFFRLLTLSRRAAAGKWAMATLSTFGRITGWLGKMATKS
jgi:hypothetical protein